MLPTTSLIRCSYKLEGLLISRLGLGCKIEFNILLEGGSVLGFGCRIEFNILLERVRFIIRIEICW